MKTHVIAVDFNDGLIVYDKIRKGIEGKDIAILGKWLTDIHTILKQSRLATCLFQSISHHAWLTETYPFHFSE